MIHINFSLPIPFTKQHNYNSNDKKFRLYHIADCWAHKHLQNINLTTLNYVSLPICGIKLHKLLILISAGHHISMMPEFTIRSCIHGYHVYGVIWTAILGKQLASECEIDNVVD